MNTHSPILPFQGFDERGLVRSYRHGLLPHWRQQGCTYFVTFRLADSLPRDVQQEWREQRDAAFQALGISSWEEARSRLAVGDWQTMERNLRRNLEIRLDAGLGQCRLREPRHARIVAEALSHFHGSRVLTGDYVVMPNHVHALLRPLPGYELEDILHSVKGYSAWSIHRRTGLAGTLWKEESYDHIVRDFDSLIGFQGYIHQNPIRAHLPKGAYLLSRCTYSAS